MVTNDLFSIAQSGVSASSQLLNNASNNIANVNTQGYVRETTVFESAILGGVGRGTTERVINVFAQNQMRRDISQVGEFRSYEQYISSLDSMMANSANSLASGLSDVFGSIQSAADDPTNLAYRDVVLSQSETYLQQVRLLSQFMRDQEQTINLDIEQDIATANTLIQGISDINRTIVAGGGLNSISGSTSLLNERDALVNELSDLMSIQVRESDSGTGALLVNLSSGESLVMDDGSFNVLQITGEDTNTQLQLATDFGGNKQDTVINLAETDIGGSMGGLFTYRDQILGDVQRDIGQLTVAFSDAMNTQNRLGMDMDMQLGGDLFTIPDFNGVSVGDTPDDLFVDGQITPGASGDFTDADLLVTVTAVAAGVPTEVSVSLLNADGSPKIGADGNPVEYNNITIGTGFTELPVGIEIDFQAPGGGSTFTVDNQFIFRPAKELSTEIQLATNRPEDLAFASPIRVEPNQDNLGSATVSDITITNTEVDAALGADASAFDGAQGIHAAAAAPGATVGAPAEIQFVDATTFNVLDAAGNTITSVTGVTDYTNLLAQAEATGTTPAWPAAFSALNDYPGYDISLAGTPVAGDSFTLSYNTDGINSNKNANAMANLQQQALVQLTADGSSTARTLHESYSVVVGNVGEDAASADIRLQAAQSMLDQSQSWFESVSGVNLDEEAANLIRYQQSYAASARILSTAQQVFDTILNAVG